MSEILQLNPMDDEDWEMPPEYTGPPMAPSPRARASAMGLANGVEPPMTKEEYDRALEHLATPWLYSHLPDPHRCVFNEAPRHGGAYFQCRTVISDPREIRYCLEHAAKVSYPLTPEQRERYTKEEARIRLQGLSSRAVATLEKVMDDPDAPAGVRAKAAVDVLDRTGFHARAGLDVQVEAVVVDLAEVIKQRLAAKREQLQAHQVVEAEIIPDPPPAS